MLPREIFHTLARGLRLAERTVRQVRRGRVRAVFCHAPWRARDVWRLAFRSGLEALPLTVGEWEWAPLPDAVFDDGRTGLAKLPATTEFDEICVRLLPQNVPRVFLEGYERKRMEALEAYGEPPRCVGSSVAWAYVEPFKLWAAEAAERGSRLIAIQHGGGYGGFRFSPFELHERRIADVFVAWGWADKEVPDCRNLPDPKMSSLLRIGSRRQNTRGGAKMLFVVTQQPRYLYRFHSVPVAGQWNEYFEWALRFLASLPSHVRSTTVYRPHVDNFGNAVNERMRGRFPEVRIENARPFHRCLAESGLVVIDHMGTSFLEAMAANVPTILFWDPDRWEVRDSAAPYFAGLRQAGILWDSPEEAAAQVIAVSDEPMRWWNSRVVQDARRRFTGRYALADERWPAQWVDALAEEASICSRAASRSAIAPVVAVPGR